MEIYQMVFGLVLLLLERLVYIVLLTTSLCARIWLRAYGIDGCNRFILGMKYCAIGPPQIEPNKKQVRSHPSLSGQEQVQHLQQLQLWPCCGPGQGTPVG